jgi:bacterial/archaeal transporter family protein
MTTWLTPAIFSLLSFGLWGFFTKLAVVHIDSKSALIYQTLGVLIIGIFAFFSMNFKLEADAKGISYAVLTGITYGLGCLFYFVAASRGKIITVVTLTALYPLITILLAYLLLKEGVTLKQVIGIILALGAIFLMA